MPESNAGRLSQISTAWTTFFLAHDGPTDEGQVARRRLLELYGVPVYRYLRAAVREPDLTDELYQEFALRLVRGDFQNVRPERGRFRDFLKTVLYHLIVDHHRKQSRPPAPLPDDEVPASTAEQTGFAESDEAFRTGWREELLARAWADLARYEKETGQPLHTVLRFRADHPEVRSPQMAEILAPRIGQPIDAGWIRRRLQRAREIFTEALLEEVAGTIEPATHEALTEELLELGLFEYCREAMEHFTFEVADYKPK